MFWRFQFFSPEGYWKNPIGDDIANTLSSVKKAKINLIYKSIPVDILNKWFMWVVILRGKATLKEMETIYSIKDTLQMYTAICISESITNVINEIEKKKGI